MPPLPFDSPQVLGAIEIGAFLGIFLFGVIVVQAHIYFKNCANDSKWLVSLITLILILELGHTIATAQSVWWATIPVANLSVVTENAWASAMCTLYAAVITCLVKGYYINRIRILTAKNWLAITGWFITSLDFAASVFGAVEAFLEVRNEVDQSDQKEWAWLITTSLALGAAVDVFIAAAMVYQLRQFRGNARANSMKGTAELVNGLIIWTIETGLLTSFVSMAVLACFYMMEFNSIWFAVYLPLAKLYSNSLLASLNARPARRRRFSTHATSQLHTGTTAHTTSLRFASFDTSSPSSSLDSRLTRLGTPISRTGSNSSARRSTVASSNVSRKIIPPGISYLRRSTVASSGGGSYERGSFSSKGSGYSRKSAQYPYLQTNAPAGGGGGALESSPNGNFLRGETIVAVAVGGKKRVTAKDQYVYSKSRPVHKPSPVTPTSASSYAGTFSSYSSSASKLHSPSVRSFVDVR
ncbi:hypothetical protein D9757_006038 [Collybiopsis confluens]|uniref:DUF6534 domain-containing protein n=1 Tax=Collybiopsis confluens TaxID=2823264 RepID=A0A8H5MCU7_9AGAR|nr:hypothetical protein D9757_006038 [Collybiopsis confluens]